MLGAVSETTIVFTLAPSSSPAWHAFQNHAKKPCWPAFTLLILYELLCKSGLFCMCVASNLIGVSLSVPAPLHLLLTVLLSPQFNRFIRLFIRPHSHLSLSPLENRANMALVCTHAHSSQEHVQFQHGFVLYWQDSPGRSKPAWVS